MTINPHEFWDSNYYDHPPLDDDMLAEAEGRLGVRLPAELVALLKIQNGGYTQGFAFPMTQATSWAADHVPLGDLAGIVTDAALDTALNLLDSADLTEEWGLPPKQVLLSGDGHWWITLDYRNGADPAVTWLDVESDEDMRIAPSFADFLAGLVPESEFYE